MKHLFQRVAYESGDFRRSPFGLTKVLEGCVNCVDHSFGAIDKGAIEVEYKVFDVTQFH